LSSLDTYIATIGNDVVKFNQHVNTLIEGLSSRGETTHDLLTNLFKGYKAASDRQFIKYIKKKEDDYDEGNDINPTTLMTLAANKYKILKEKNEWEAAPSPDKEKVLALEAKISNMSKGNKFAAKSKSNPTTTKTNKKDMSWKYIEPPEDIKKKVKMWDDKEWWWCTNHKAFVRHKPEDCERKGVKPSATSNVKTTSKGPDKNTRQLRFSKALQAVNDDKDDDGKESSDEE
jgi:hypothetical protein